MALESGFFDSTEVTDVDGIPVGNKAKNAAFMAAFIKNLIQTGYLPTIENCFKISPSSAMTVSRAAGAAFIEGYLVIDATATTELLTADTTYAWLLRLDLGDGEITEELLVDPTPVTDYPLRAGNYFDLVLAVITVPSGALTVTAEMISDKRNDFDYCGYAKMAPASNLEFSDLLAIDGKVNPDKLTSNIIEVTASKTLALTDASTVQQVNSASNLTITIPLNSAVEFPIDTEIEIVRWGSGTVTVAAAGGVTLRAMGSPAAITIYAQYGILTLKKFADNIWLVAGALS
ncbi:MAG: hypothetical protein ACYCWE_20895 [Eubacteriales bacterium]